MRTAPTSVPEPLPARHPSPGTTTPTLRWAPTWTKSTSVSTRSEIARACEPLAARRSRFGPLTVAGPKGCSVRIQGNSVASVRAVVITRHGGCEVLRVEERPDPPVGPGEVRIAVRAAGINFADLMARSGVYPDAPPPPCVIGYEVAGEIESVGDGVRGALGRRPGAGGDPVRRLRGAGHGSCGPGAAAARRAQLRAGSGLSGQLRDRRTRRW